MNHRNLAVDAIRMPKSKMQARQIWSAIALVVGYLVVSASPMHYWDEYFYLYSVQEHSPSELFALDENLSGLFPVGFFLTKAAFVYLLAFLVGVVGSGIGPLLFLQSVFALISVLFLWVTYQLYSELVGKNKAFSLTVILAFLPVTTYLGFKVLSEMPSLLCVSFACWQLLKSFQSEDSKDINLCLVLSTLGLFFAGFFRYTSLALFGGLVVSVWIFYADRFPRRNLFLRSVCVGVGSGALLIFAWTWIAENPIELLSGVVKNLVQRKQSSILKLHTILIFFQGFLPLFVLGLLRFRDRLTGLGVVWLGSATLPFLVASDYTEPRFLYLGVVPLAILVQQGWSHLMDLIGPREKKVLTWSLFIALIIFNRLFFFPIMPYEHNEREYQRLMNRQLSAQPTATWVTPWLSDFCYLRFAYPEQSIRLALSWSKNGNPEFFRTPEFIQWSGKESYVGSIAELENTPSPWLYVAWDYNPAVKAIKQRLDWFGFGQSDMLEKKEGLKDHRRLSWIWESTKIKRSLIESTGHYAVYELTRTY